MGQILLCDDEVKLSRMLTAALSSAGHNVERVGTGRDAIERCAAATFDLVITDLRLPDCSGIDVLKQVHKESSDPEVIMITAFATAETAVEAMRLGAFDYLIKPFSIDELRIKIAHILSQRALREHNGQLQRQLDTLRHEESLVGSSARMREVFEQLHQVAATDATVLLVGESGTGKTALARALHSYSNRRNGPLCELHCAALPESLLESELFGHERGAFTGAVEQRIGHVERAHNGTLFLDEIGELPSSIQVKLLRFIQDRQFFRVGSSKIRSVDVRFVFASNRDLEQAVRDRQLREDFYYRINVFPIQVPALRERADDIPQLASTILRRRHHDAEIAPEALAVLQRYPWPGNVRELENVLERAAIVAAASGSGPLSIRLRHLPTNVTELASTVTASSLLRPGFSIDRLERELIRESLARTSGNKSESARLLGITRRRLYSRLKSIETAEAEEAAAASSESPKNN